MIYLIGAVLLYTVAILFGTAAARNANTNLVSAITNITSILIPLAVVIPHLSKKAITNHKFGVLSAVASGIVVGLFVMSFNKSLTQNKVGIVTPVIFGGAIFLSTILSIYVFKEKVSLMEGLGLFLVLAGLAVIVYARAAVA